MVCLLRELQGTGYIDAIYKGEVEHMLDGSDFIKDSLFCEYAYLIDLDKMTLDFYKGYQKKSQKGNRFGTEKGEGDYYPCKKIGNISLKGISESKDNVEEMMMMIYKTVEEA